jgi:hypothetical protein
VSKVRKKVADLRLDLLIADGSSLLVGGLVQAVQVTKPDRG